MGSLRRRKRTEEKFLTFNDTLTSGITKVDGTKPVVVRDSYEQYGDSDTDTYVSVLRVNQLKKAISADAAEAFGEHIASFPLGLIQPLGAYVKLISTCATGLSATAGEVGLGSVIASGAANTLTGTATFGDLMDGTTLSNHVAATALTSHKANNPDLTGAKPTHGVQVLDGSATAKKIHLNLASDWNQTAAESITFEATIRLYWRWLGAGA